MVYSMYSTSKIPIHCPVIGFTFESPNYFTILLSQITFVAAVDRAVYSSSVVIVASIGYLLLYQDTALSSMTRTVRQDL